MAKRDLKGAGLDPGSTEGSARSRFHPKPWEKLEQKEGNRLKTCHPIPKTAKTEGLMAKRARAKRVSPCRGTRGVQNNLK